MTPLKNGNKNVIVWGDIHGCSRALIKAIEISESCKFDTVFLGDYIDRGPDSVGCIDILIRAKERNKNWNFLMGNHEHMLLDLFMNPNLVNKSSKLLNGDNFSYFETSKTYFSLIHSDLKLMNVKSFLSNLQLFYKIDNWIFVHASLKNNAISLDKKPLEDLLWNYEEIPEWDRTYFVHGHNRVNQISMHGHGININTSCGFGGYLTGVIIDIERNQIKKVLKISEDGQVL